MAGRFVSLVLDGVDDIDPSAKLVLVTLADCANKRHGGVAFPSVATRSRRTGICERQVRDHLRLLESLKWITREGTGKGGRGMTTRYRLDVVRMLAVVTENPAVHLRLSIKKPGTAPPSNSDGNSAVQRTKPGSPPPKTRQPTADELEVDSTGSKSTGSTGADNRVVAAQLQTLLTRIRQEEQTRRHMTREEQIAAAKLHDPHGKR